MSAHTRTHTKRLCRGCGRFPPAFRPTYTATPDRWLCRRCEREDWPSLNQQTYSTVATCWLRFLEYSHLHPAGWPSTVPPTVTPGVWPRVWGLGMALGATSTHPVPTDFTSPRGSAFAKNPQICDRCSRCSRWPPTNLFHREVTFSRSRRDFRYPTDYTDYTSLAVWYVWPVCGGYSCDWHTHPWMDGPAGTHLATAHLEAHSVGGRSHREDRGEAI